MKELVCIICPRGCLLKISESNNVTGNFCLRGKEYALKEMTNPERTLTSFIEVSNRKNTVVSIKTSKPIPKNKMFEVMNILKEKSVIAPIKNGEILINNILNMDINIVSTKEIK